MVAPRSVRQQQRARRRAAAQPFRGSRVCAQRPAARRRGAHLLDPCRIRKQEPECAGISPVVPWGMRCM